MPHVIVEGPVSVEKFYQHFETFSFRQDDVIFKVKDVFINQKKHKMLLECIVVEDRMSHVFYLVVTQQETERVTVRLDPLTSPEKTAGVKRFIALIGHKLKSQHADCRYGAHNLEGYLFA
ncbi:MAG: hypothetical protein RBT80_01520 [Candidatus Vecturithrix sp.]|jgi:hypothetical protein|nr:hypothetical protein [Candidatus Vecturithrix sp.]